MIEKIRDGGELDPGDVAIAIAELVSETVEDEQKVEFLGQLHRHGETAGEIVAFAKVLLERATDPGIDLASLPGPAIDVCESGRAPSCGRFRSSPRGRGIRRSGGRARAGARRQARND